MNPEGTTIVTGAGDETLRFWNIFPKKEKESKDKSNLNTESICLRWCFLIDAFSFTYRKFNIDNTCKYKHYLIRMTTPIYRYHAVQKGKSGWRFTFSPNPMLGEGWSFDGIAFHVPK